MRCEWRFYFSASGNILLGEYANSLQTLDSPFLSFTIGIARVIGEARQVALPRRVNDEGGVNG